MVNKLTKRVLVVVILAVLSGCGTTTVNELSPSTFSVSAQYGALNGSWDRAQKEAVAKGKEFCAAKGETFAFISEQQSGVVGYSWQRSTIYFSCGPSQSSKN
jgi:outer membrane biogenesis lipoprotein LolB